MEKILVTIIFFSHNIFKSIFHFDWYNTGMFCKHLYIKINLNISTYLNKLHFKGGYLDFSHLTELKNICIIEIYMKQQYESSII